MPKSKLKPIPKFQDEDEERDFWAKVDSSEYFDWDNPVALDLSQLKPTTQSISIRIPAYLLRRIKQLANSRDVPYQSLMKLYLAERVEKELHILSIHGSASEPNV